MKRLVMTTMAVFSLLCFMIAPVLEAAPRLSVQITLYNLEEDATQPIAIGRAALTTIEQRARLNRLSIDEKNNQRSYERDVFYLKRMPQDQTGAIRFRVRHEQIIENRCTAMEIRDYAIQLGDTCELYSDRGQIRAVMKLCVDGA
ncbi:MAG: hypothetical protein J5477_05680 [Schwartzia sp.]|nr:hypothetical protein [Schwartzia sp. (in: firmicutes)]